MAAFTKFQQFVEDLAHGVHDLSGDTLKVMLTNTAPDAAADAVKGDLTEIGTGFGYSAGGTAASISSSGQTSGVYKLVLADVVFTASGGGIGPFQWAVLWNDTPSSPADPLLAFWDYGAAVTLVDGETFTVDFSSVNGVLQIS